MITETKEQKLMEFGLNLVLNVFGLITVGSLILGVLMIVMRIL